jgi:hypothetical protein
VADAAVAAAVTPKHKYKNNVGRKITPQGSGAGLSISAWDAQWSPYPLSNQFKPFGDSADFQLGRCVNWGELLHTQHLHISTSIF